MPKGLLALGMPTLLVYVGSVGNVARRPSKTLILPESSHVRRAQDPSQLPADHRRALAAASAAIASSWLGVAGTVISAAVVSVVASIGSVIYTRPIERSHERLLAVATARGTTHR